MGHKLRLVALKLNELIDCTKALVLAELLLVKLVFAALVLLGDMLPI